MMKLVSIAVLIAVVGIGGYLVLRSSNNPSVSQLSESPVATSTPTEAVTVSPAVSPSVSTTPLPNIVKAVITVDRGVIELDLNAKAAPLTVANFVKLANEKFYDGLTFHRVVPNFVAQGGDPKGDGTGGPGYNVPAEIGLKHKKGAIATARTGDTVNPKRESSGSQFYIALKDLPELDGQYTVFGQVTKGMDVVLKIQVGDIIRKIEIK